MHVTSEFESRGTDLKLRPLPTTGFDLNVLGTESAFVCVAYV